MLNEVLDNKSTAYQHKVIYKETDHGILTKKQTGDDRKILTLQMPGGLVHPWVTGLAINLGRTS